jgi:hypothetical protein
MENGKTMEREKGKEVKGKEMNNGMIDSRQLLFNCNIF